MRTARAGGEPDLAGFDPTTRWQSAGQGARCLALRSCAAGHGIKKDAARPKSARSYWLCCESEDHQTPTSKCSWTCKLSNSADGWKLSLLSEPRPCLRHSPFCTSEPNIGARASAEDPAFRAAVQSQMQQQKGKVTLKQVIAALATQRIPISQGGTSIEAQQQNAYRIRQLVGQPDLPQTDLWSKAPALAAAYKEQNPGLSITPPLPPPHSPSPPPALVPDSCVFAFHFWSLIRGAYDRRCLRTPGVRPRR